MEIDPEDLNDPEIVVIPPELLEKASPEEQEAYFQYLVGQVKRVDEWEPWLRLFFPRFASKPFSQGHKEFWDWVWSVEIDNKPRPWVSIWPRGHAKSTSAELAIAALAARGKRKYGLLICETQDQADDHVANVAAMLQSSTIELAYPDLGQPAFDKQGHSKGWRRNRIVTASGFILDACGLDSAARGIKFEEQRPDFMVFDDIDGELDGEATTAKKIKVITQKLLPAGAPNCAVLMVQNLVHENSIFARLCSDGSDDRPEPADWLRNRIVSGPIPAVEGLEVEEREEDDGSGGVLRRWIITAGTATWPEGFPIEVCEAQINEFGLTAFMAECQHVTEPPDGEIFSHLKYDHVDYENLPRMKRVVCWVDPAVSERDTSDSMGIQIDGLGDDNRIYRLYSWEQRATPYSAIKHAIKKAIQYKADVVGIETNQGDQLWRVVYDQAMEDVRAEVARTIDPETGKKGDFFRKMPRYKEKKATKDLGSKVIRAERMLVDYERFVFVHVLGTHQTLEKALKRFPKVKPYDLVDACLVPGSLVATEGGEVPIEQIKPGDRVWTRQGLRTVSDAGPTATNVPVYELRTANGNRLIGTGDHLVWTVEYGWVPLAMAVGLTVSIGSWNQSKSNTQVASTVGTPTANVAATAFTTTPPAQGTASLYIDASISTITGQSQMAGMCTMSTATPSTTTPAISEQSPPRTIGRPTGEPGAILSPWKSILLQSDPWPLNGTAVMREGGGTKSMDVDHGTAESPLICPANGVAPPSPPSSPRPGTVPSHAETRDSLPTIPTKTSEAVKNAGNSSLPTAGRLPASAGSLVATVRSLGVAEVVYDLEVEGAHEYFADGVLVHNCYWSWAELAGPMHRRKMKLKSSARRSLSTGMGVANAPTRPIGM